MREKRSIYERRRSISRHKISQTRSSFKQKLEKLNKFNYYFSDDSVDVTSEPDDQDMSVAASSHNPNKGQLEVQLGGAVTLQCPQGKQNF